MLVALILPGVAIPALGWMNFDLKRENTQDREIVAVAQALLSKLENIKLGELGASVYRA